jgi:hypothetical protein
MRSWVESSTSFPEDAEEGRPSFAAARSAAGGSAADRARACSVSLLGKMITPSFRTHEYPRAVAPPRRDVLANAVADT